MAEKIAILRKNILKKTVYIDQSLENEKKNRVK